MGIAERIKKIITDPAITETLEEWIVYIFLFLIFDVGGFLIIWKIINWWRT